MDLDPSQYGAADRRAVDPPIPVEIATWSKAGQLAVKGKLRIRTRLLSDSRPAQGTLLSGLTSSLVLGLPSLHWAFQV
jgi:hypothetical protein